jgi:hypothetical protein
MEKICREILMIFVCAVVMMSQESSGDDLHVRHSAGGRSIALELGNQYWYQSLGDKLVVIRKQGNGQVATRMLTTYPAAATCTDLLIAGETLYALLDGTEVVTFNLRHENVPVITRRQSTSVLGIVPRRLVMVGDWPVVIGEGGAVRLTDGSQLVACDEAVTGIAMSMNRGVVYAEGNVLYDGDTREIVGSATTLVELDDNANADIGTLVYTIDLGNRTEVGLLGGGMRTIDSAIGRVILDGSYRNLLSRGSRLIVSTNEAVYVVGIAPDELRVLQKIALQGVHDVDVIASNYLAVCGEFGRGVYRIADDRGGLGSQLIRIEPSLGVMAPGQFDLRGVHIPSGSGSVYYGFDQTIMPSSAEVTPVNAPTNAIVLGLEATIDQETGDVVIEDARGRKMWLTLSGPATTIVPIGGNFWVGTENGIDILGRDAFGQCVELGSIQLAGPIVQLIPLFDGSAAFVSGAGMVGIVERTQAVAALEQ